MHQTRLNDHNAVARRQESQKACDHVCHTCGENAKMGRHWGTWTGLNWVTRCFESKQEVPQHEESRGRATAAMSSLFWEVGLQIEAEHLLANLSPFEETGAKEKKDFSFHSFLCQKQ